MKTGMRLAGLAVVLLAVAFFATMQPVSAANLDDTYYLPMMGAADSEIAAAADSFGPSPEPYSGVAVSYGYLAKGDFEPSDPCAALGYELAFKVDGVPSNMQYSGNGWTVDIVGATDETFGWELVSGVTGQGISAAIIKAGTGANYYDYGTTAPVADYGLHTPGFEKKDEFTYRQISNFSFCTVEISEPSIDIEKCTYGWYDEDGLGGPEPMSFGCWDADTEIDAVGVISATVTWEYEITNTGPVDLYEIEVYDDQEDGPLANGMVCYFDSLPSGASETCSLEAPRVTPDGVYENVGTVYGNDGTVEVEDSDPSHYYLPG